MKNQNRRKKHRSNPTDLPVTAAPNDRNDPLPFADNDDASLPPDAPHDHTDPSDGTNLQRQKKQELQCIWWDRQEAYKQQLKHETQADAIEWHTEDTGIQVPIDLMISIELLKPDSPLVTIQHWKKCHSVCDIKTTLINLHDVLQSKSKAANDLRQQLTAKLGSPQVLLDLHSHLFCYTLKIDKHRDHETNVMFRANFDFIPDKIFHDPNDHHHMANIYLRQFEQGHGEINTMPQTGMMYGTPEKTFAPFHFHHSQEVSDGLKHLFQLLLAKYAGMDQDQALEMLVAFLYTRSEEKMQAPHFDYNLKTIDAYLNSPNSRGPNYLPWSMDMPLNKDGMRLAFYGPYDERMNKTPTMVHVPFRKCLFWRADCLHAGGFADLNGGPGFRMHAYIPLDKHQRHTMLEIRPTIFTKNRDNQRIEQLVNGPDGTRIPGGNELMRRRTGPMSDPLPRPD
jgi:hypothetical protein